MKAPDNPVVTLCVEMTDPAPISVNAMYSTYMGRRVLTAEGRHFKDCLKHRVVEATSVLDTDWDTIWGVVYRDGGFTALHIDLYLAAVRNKSWKPGGGRAPKGKAQSPYQKQDASSYIKIVQDAVAEGLGIDDSAEMWTSVAKHEDPMPRVVITYCIYV